MALQCEECSHNFTNASALRQHNIDKHHYYCATCHVSLGSKGALDQHNKSLVHEPRQWQCPLCLTRRKRRKGNFKTPSALTQHLESGIHANVTRYHIIAATQALSTPAPVAIHPTPGVYSAPAPMKVIGGVATKATSWNGSAFQCGECQKTFRKLSALNMHLASAVHDDPEVRCPGCAAEFALTSALVRHLESGACGMATYARVQMESRALLDTVSGMLTC
ncbi:hypothetical protein HDZ31DRAFT_59525 [Schizophyllum fasciatum]